jgi:hypothetical protein
MWHSAAEQNAVEGAQQLLLLNMQVNNAQLKVRSVYRASACS